VGQDGILRADWQSAPGLARYWLPPPSTFPSRPLFGLPKKQSESNWLCFVKRRQVVNPCPDDL
jgi:hypothetical protein